MDEKNIDNGEILSNSESKNGFSQRKATKLSKNSFKAKKREYKLVRKKYKTLKIKSGKESLTAKKKLNEAKKSKKLAKKEFKNAKKNDTSRIAYQAKGSVKQSLKNKGLSAVGADDTLREGVAVYNKGQQYKKNMRLSLQLTKNASRTITKASKGTYGLGNRLLNYSRGRGFQRTPNEFTLRKQAMNRMRNFRQRLKAAKEAKKAEKGLRLLNSVLRGDISVKKAASILLKSPASWLVFLVLFLVCMVVGVVATSQKPPIVQDDFELTEAWTHLTKIDAENSDISNVFYTSLDDVMYYMNNRFEDYKVSDLMGNQKTYRHYLSELWEALNGHPPEFKLTTMNQLATNKDSSYYIDSEEYEEMQKMIKRLGYGTLDGQLAFPYATNNLVINRRYGYERHGENVTLNTGIEASVEQNQEILAPITGIVDSVKPTSLIIKSDDDIRITLGGLNTNRFKGGETISSGEYVGNSTENKLTIIYEKFDSETEKWRFVNPGFYFEKVTYKQFTSLAKDKFSPDKDVASRAQAVYDYLTKLGYTREGISAILGNFSVESSINPKRAEGDYLSPPVGASETSWDDPEWLSLGGMDIYGKYPNIIHRGLGLGQWTDTADGGRRHTMLLDFARTNSKSWYLLDLQLDFMLNGDSPGSRTMFTNTAGSKVGITIPELTTYFLNNWEGNPGDKLSDRIQAAQGWYNYFSNSTEDLTASSKEIYEKYKDKINPLPTEKEMKEGWGGNNYALGNCTWYVYNRMKQLGKTIHPTMGNANQWVTNYTKTPGAALVSDPRAGDIVIFTNGVAGTSKPFGHVAVIEFVNEDGSFVISEMNVQGAYSMGWRVLTKQDGMYFMHVI